VSAPDPSREALGRKGRKGRGLAKADSYSGHPGVPSWASGPRGTVPERNPALGAARMVPRRGTAPCGHAPGRAACPRAGGGGGARVPPSLPVPTPRPCYAVPS